MLALLLVCWALPAPPLLADGGSDSPGYGPPPQAPPPAHDTDTDDPPRRDIHMGTVDNMRFGRDADGNEVMEVKARSKKAEEQPQVGPFYIYPQVGVPGQPMGGQTGRPGQTGQSLPMAGQSGRTQTQQGVSAGNQSGRPAGVTQPQPGQGQSRSGPTIGGQTPGTPQGTGTESTSGLPQQ